ncbi:radical SAM protein [[Clostridium] polysaccharolyticum]|uniref:4Fe-4S single cluster domain-containing protein n=1 Tax=[Clostridium] polysaccharolyticum TaxID=29364 RepID=A0A1I0B9X4_9FIRM|nr:radical SAM protein [[Clostridium] polysaccharolyticum]SET03328.1 4Fe-4S single cluster domain-containing protein [[Clostridium] polysaccharolyticum]
MNYKYFQLNNECYLVIGKKRATIHNLLKREIIWLDEEQTKLALMFENGEKVDCNNSFIESLCQAGWGFSSEKKYYIDKIRTKNLFTQNMFYKERPIIYSCTLHLTNECNLNCNKCGNIYCPSCIKYEDNSLPQIDQLKVLITELKDYGLHEVVLAGGEVALYQQLEELIEYCVGNKLRVTVNTNGLIKVKADGKIQIILNIFSHEQLELVQKNYKETDNVFVILHDMKKETEFLNPTWRAVEKDTSLPEMKTATMRKLGVLEFNTTKFWNTCLCNRIHIMNNLDVVTCLGKTELIGNLKSDSLSSIVLKLYENQWKDTKAADDNNGCSLCEFRYSCTPCILTKKKEPCNLV